MELLSHKARQAPPNATAVYVRHRPETTLLYQIVDEYWPEFQAELASQDKYLPAYVIQEFEAYLKCGRLEHGFLRVRCETCHDEKLVAYSCKRRGFCPSCGARRMADSAALLVDDVLPHQPMRQLAPGMACSRAMQEQLPRVLSVPFPLRFLFASQPAVMGRVLGIVYRTIATHLIHKAGYTKATAQTGAITYRIAIGPQQGRKVFTLQTIPDCGDDTLASTVGKVAGFSLHAGVAARANEREKLERLCRYIARPAISTKRLSLTRNGQVRYELKTPYNDGTTHVIFEPLDFISRLVALVPRPRVNLTRYHGVFAPNSKYRALVTPAKRGKGKKGIAAQQQPDPTPAERRASMTWPLSHIPVLRGTGTS